MPSTTTSQAANVWLWIAQSLLALLFVFAGVVKLVMPAQALAQGGLPVGFMRFIAVAELCGALGLVLPGVLRVRRELTPIAALGLIVIMAGATTVTLATQAPTVAVLPLVVGIVLGVVLWGRRSWLSRR
jgi:hypothetical protein